MSSGDALAVGRKRERTYLRRLLHVMGAKGIVVLIALPAAVVLSGDIVHPILAGGVLTGGLVYALLVDSDSSEADIHPETDVKMRRDKPLVEMVDGVGLAFVVLSLGYIGVAATGIGVGWGAAVIGASVVVGAVVFDYVVTTSDDDDLSVDVVGFAVAEVLVLYALVTGTGWDGFAESATFGAIAFLIYVGTVVAFAGHAAVTREVVVSRTDDDIHGTLFGILENVRDVKDEKMRKEMASEIRSAAESLDGVELPSAVEDDEGAVPVVVSTRQPDGRVFATDPEEILETARDENLTGYVVYGGDVMLFRNGGLSKFYVDGEYGYDASELDGDILEATFYSVNHGALNALDGVTPSEETGTVVVTEKEVIEDDEDEEGMEAEEKEKAEEDEIGTLDIGGDEIDVEEMFEKADEIIDELE